MNSSVGWKPEIAADWVIAPRARITQPSSQI
jgi:hypothetical protein